MNGMLIIWNYWINRFSVWFILVGILVVSSGGCHLINNKKEVEVDPVNGKQLSEIYCSTCHIYPDPNLLDKKTWSEKVLPAMAHRFGIYTDIARDSLIETGKGGYHVLEAGIFPNHQMISDAQWEAIVQYYISMAPDSLAIPVTQEFNKGINIIKVVLPDLSIERASISALSFDQERTGFYVADCSKEDHSTVTILDSDYQPITQLGLPYPVSKVINRPEGLYMLMMRHLIPSDDPSGSLLKAVKDQEKNSYKGYSKVVNNLKRPVDMVFVDAENDQDDDLVICEFGNHTGSLSLFINNGKNKYKKKLLVRSPGAIKVLANDLNNDALSDLIILMSQGDESIDIYYNQGNGDFKRDRVLRFPPVYGSTDLSMIDFNQDGYPDILYVNGDNADFSSILKPYHGIRIFLNDGKNHFEETLFLPLHGAYKAIADDFDQDGDIDIAAISFFPDFNNESEKGFVYYENISQDQHMKFEPFIIPTLKTGRWITMSSDDFDNDGDADILLGNFMAMDIPGDTGNLIKNQIMAENTTLVLLKNSYK